MNRTEFEALRDLQGKRIQQDIRFSRREALKPVLEINDIIIENDHGVDLRMNLHYNPETGSKTVNVFVPGTGPICRLDIDGSRHGDSGRSHKHALQSERCPNRNLRDNVEARAELAGHSMHQVFADFCSRANIDHIGAFIDPDEVTP